MPLAKSGFGFSVSICGVFGWTSRAETLIGSLFKDGDGTS
jgi:hypothetical protein